MQILVLFVLLIFVHLQQETETKYSRKYSHPRYRKVSSFLPPACQGYSRSTNIHHRRNARTFPQQQQLPGLLPQEPGLSGSESPDPNAGCDNTKPKLCLKNRYRSIDGSCNNLRFPPQGSSQTAFSRLLPPKYGNGINTIAKNGTPLPSPREISLALYPEFPIESEKWTLNVMQYGQLIGHDMSLTAVPAINDDLNLTDCCISGQLKNISNSCLAILLPENDPIKSSSNTTCMSFIGSSLRNDSSCINKSKPVEQINSATHYLDLSMVYGSTNETNEELRQFKDGKLISVIVNDQEWLPNSINVSKACVPGKICYFAGDERVNQNPQLALLQIIFLREHNRIADELCNINSDWEDEILFQEARKINIAQHQHISYYEWLPIIIGPDPAYRRKLIYGTKNLVNDYQENVDPSVINEHATAAFRFFHSLIAGRLQLVNEHRESQQSLRLSDWFNRPGILERDDNFEKLARGLASQPSMADDRFHDNEITQFLFRGNNRFGSDLKAIDIQRNRNHGLASYNDLRSFCRLKKAQNFTDFLDVMSDDNVKKLSSLYDHPDDVDLTVGGSLEKSVFGALAGPTFLCILKEQFFRTKIGDRFWFEREKTETGFTLEQLTEIRKISLARLFCQNIENIEKMQPKAFEQISKSNAVVPCESLPEIDLSMWKEVNKDDIRPQIRFRKPKGRSFWTVPFFG